MPQDLRGAAVLTDPLFLVAAFVAVFFLGVAKGGFSGVGSIATPVLALVVPPLQAAAILLPILLAQDVVSVWNYRRHWDRWNVKVMLAGAVVGVAAAGALAAYVSESAIRLTIGLISLAFVLNYWFGTGDLVRRPGIVSGVLCGAGSGFTSTLAHAGAPPYQIHVLPQRLDKLTLVGTSAVFFAAVNALKVVPFFALAQLTAENLATSAMLIPLAVATNYFGFWLVRVTPAELFYRITYFLTFLLSLELIRSGVTGLLAS